MIDSKVRKNKDIGKYVDSIRKYLLDCKESIAAAESVTAGLVQFFIASVPDASFFFQGGITAYNIGQKYRHLSVEPIHALSCDCVSEEVASQMALNICPLFGSSWGLGITGYAVSVPESEHKLYAYFAIAHDSKVVVSKRVKPSMDDPKEVQFYYTEILLRETCMYMKMLRKAKRHGKARKSKFPSNL